MKMQETLSLLSNSILTDFYSNKQLPSASQHQVQSFNISFVLYYEEARTIL